MVLKIENREQIAIEFDKKVLFQEGIFLDNGNDNGVHLLLCWCANYRALE